MTVEPVVDVLRQTNEEKLKSNESMQLSYERLVNRVHLHSHNINYCLREVKEEKKGETEDEKKTKEKTMDKPASNDTILEPGTVIKDGKLYKCRFGFDKALVGYTKDFGEGMKQQVFKSVQRKYPQSPVIPEGVEVISDFETGKKDLVYLRNHPAVNDHSKEISLLWGANTDVKYILHPDHLIGYLTNYVTKGEKASNEMHSISRAAIAKVNEDSPVRSVLQKTIMKAVERDKSRQECYQELAGISPVKCSKDFRLVSVTGEGKCINIDGDLNQKISDSKNVADVYWGREKDPNYHAAISSYNEDPDAWQKLFIKTWKVAKSPADVTLHEFAAFFTKNWTPSKTEFIPVISPCFMRPPTNTKKAKDAYELFCRSSLLEYKPGCNPDNIKGGFDSLHEALKDFVSNDDWKDICPRYLKSDFQIANTKKKKKKDDANAADGEEEDEEGEEEEEEEEEETLQDCDKDKIDDQGYDDLYIEPNGKICFVCSNSSVIGGVFL